MTKKLFRKLITISAVLLFLVSVPVNANQCTDNCWAEANYCASEASQLAWQCWEMGTQCNSQCMYWCDLWGWGSPTCVEFCGDMCDPIFYQCQELYYDAMQECQNDLNDCLNACY